ncbi:MAG: hypothetical protein J6P61_00675, partial [Erysipelotrichaceae bacterium]|nr:hypothetical protein [Erysipelotrichaceae bacterium]
MKEIHININGETKHYCVLLRHFDETRNRHYVIYSDYDMKCVYVAGINDSHLYPVNDDEYKMLCDVYQSFINHTDVPGGHTCICGSHECVCEEMMADCHN